MTDAPYHPVRFPTRPRPLTRWQRLKGLTQNWLPLIPAELYTAPHVTRRFGWHRVHFVAHPPLIKDILRDTATFERSKTIQQIFEPMVGESVL
ncbi:MAG: hypothetical protein AAF701_05720, partial [Pseudomonadota bacterium]